VLFATKRRAHHGVNDDNNGSTNVKLPLGQISRAWRGRRSDASEMCAACTASHESALVYRERVVSKRAPWSSNPYTYVVRVQ